MKLAIFGPLIFARFSEPMTAQSSLDHHGNFLTHPFAEVWAEIAHARLTGSLRITADDRKIIVYFKSGKVAYAVSNARAYRLLEILVDKKRVEPSIVGTLPKFSSDLEFVDILNSRAIFLKSETDQFIVEQVQTILIDTLGLNSGEWHFSPLARLRDGVKFNIPAEQILLNYGRCITVNTLLTRFRTLKESFRVTSMDSSRLELLPHEALTLSRFNGEPTPIEQIITMNSMSETTAIKSIYTLWLAGLLQRSEWNPAFSDHKISAIRNANLEIRREALEFTSKNGDAAPEKTGDTPVKPSASIPTPEISLHEYLERVEAAQTYYDVLGIDPKMETAEIKQAYFALAKMFHPDKFHSFGGEKLRRIQSAFTELAQSYETLKSKESRELYDYRVRKELAEREKLKEAIKKGDTNIHAVHAAEYFERGFDLLMANDTVGAMPFLAKAANLAPKNARYRAYFGKALSYDKNQRHKAESELQTAIKIDGYNPTYRILLAEFFVEHNLLKRAEGELKRLLGIFPSNREAVEMLEKLSK